MLLKPVITKFLTLSSRIKMSFKILWAVLGINAVLHTYTLNKNLCVQGKMFIQEYWVSENSGIVIIN